jgi:hypothetical protein
MDNLRDQTVQDVSLEFALAQRNTSVFGGSGTALVPLTLFANFLDF